MCQNGDIPLLAKLSSILPTFSNYIGICPCFKTRHYHNQVCVKLDDLIIEFLQDFCHAASQRGIFIFLIRTVHARNETVGLELTWAQNLFVEWASGFPTLGHSRHRDSK